jgi:membrane protease YdiL (CAAX protease family)
MHAPRLKTRIVCELVTLGILTILYFVVFPDSSTLVDVSLAHFGLLMLALNARFTKRIVWAQFPLSMSQGERWRRCLASILPVTLIAGLLCAGTGMIIGYIDNGWHTAWHRVANWHILMAACVYFPWALVQQTLCQFYLLGRLRTLLPPATAITCTGLVYGLVHVPDLGVMVVTAVAGIFWTYLYFHYRVLTLLALSHVVLGSTFYYWIYGRDLVMRWGQLVLGTP